MCRNATYILKSAKPVAAEDIRAVLKVRPSLQALNYEASTCPVAMVMLGELEVGCIFGLPLRQWLAGSALLLSSMFRDPHTCQAKKSAMAPHHIVKLEHSLLSDEGSLLLTQHN